MLVSMPNPIAVLAVVEVVKLIAWVTSVAVFADPVQTIGFAVLHVPAKARP